MEATSIKGLKTTQAFILAGGRGERLRPITDTIPKVMVMVNNRPFLEYQLENLKKFGINDIILSVGYLWEAIRDHFGDGSEFDVEIKYSVEDRFLGTGGALKLAKDNLASTFFIIYGDTYLPIDYTQLESFYWDNTKIQQDLIGVMTVYNNQYKIVNNNVIINPQNYILKYNKEEETEDMNGIEAGVSIFNKKVLGYIPHKEDFHERISFEQEVYPQLIQKRQLLGFRTDNRFYDIGTPERLKAISEVLK